jgi:tritrans,polycis-undecaprenyl-diphosphate synthase [geranylgeranyl-diphosphate specific]|tara:strand:+ start:542 stop:1228 length:687 start_codon:yes stop_codon:yes gene_type:complete
MTTYPNHLAIIPDGCRRWAKQNGMLPWEGHKKGIEIIEELVQWFIETYPTKYITGYGLSIENFNRAKSQLEALARLYSHHFSKIAEDERTHKNEVKVQVLGRIDLLPKKVQEAANQAMEVTKHYDKKVFNIALAYSGRSEIVDAVKKLNNSNSEITEEAISNNLYQPDVPEPDIIFRSSGEQRVSNFLLWQGAYAELFFVDKFWPDVQKKDFQKAMVEFSERQRRYGV